MSLYRLGWHMPNFCTTTNDLGETLQLLLLPPKLVGALCRAAVLRGLERSSGEKLGVGHRLCWGIVRSQIRSKRSSPRGRSTMRALACNAIWTA
eukprot:6893123-Pyramimonas_sp.AAC.1